MTQIKHTPRPWKLLSADGSMIVANGSHIASVPRGGPIDDPEFQANARLICAAPDMLAALQTVVACPQAAVALARVGTGKFIGLDQWGGEKWASNALDDIRAAIAKATA